MDVNVFTGDRNLVVICQDNPETKKNLNEFGRLTFEKYKTESPLYISITIAALTVETLR
jgi:hypothetical protein